MPKTYLEQFIASTKEITAEVMSMRHDIDNIDYVTHGIGVDPLKEQSKRLKSLEEKPWLSKGSPWGESEKDLIKSLIMINTAALIEIKRMRGLHPEYFSINERGDSIVSNGVLPADMWSLAGYISMPADRRKIHWLAKDFGRQLAKADLDVPTRLLREAFEERHAFYVEADPGVFFDQDDGSSARCFFATMTTGVSSENGEYASLLNLNFPDFDERGGLTGTSSWVMLDVTHGERVSEALEKALSLPRMGESGVSRRNVELAAKVIIYLCSGEPDLREEMPPIRPSTKNDKKIRAFERETADKSLLPIVRVGYSFMKERRVGVEETEVSGHFRWQPWGEGRSKVKLIWIDPHVRRYEL